MNTVEAKLKNNYIWIAVTDCIYSVSRLFCDVFLIAYLLKISKDNFTSVGFYWLAVVSTIMFFSFLLKDWLKNGYDLIIYRLGIISNFALFIWLYLIGNNVSEYMFVTGIFTGLSMALRGLGRIFLTSKNVSDKNMIKFRGYIEVIKSFLRIAVPFLLGIFLMKDASFNEALILISVTLVLEYASTYKIYAKTTSDKKTCLKQFIEKNKKNDVLSKAYKMDFFRGLTIQGILPTTVTLYAVYLFGDNFKLGVVTSFLCICTLIINFLFGKFCKYSKFVFIAKLTGIFSVLCALIFVIIPAKSTFLIYNFSYVTIMQVIWLVTEVNMFNVANLNQIKQHYQTEYFVIREMFLGIGKIIGTVLLIIISMFENIYLLNIFLLFLTIGMAIMNFYVVSLNKKLFKK